MAKPGASSCSIQCAKAPHFTGTVPDEAGIMRATTTIKGCCPLDCQDTCAWVAHVEDGKVTKVEGARDHPMTRGVLCAKVNDYQARTYAPDRLLHPLRRTGPKGSGSFERIGWEEALDAIAGRFKAIIADHGPGALMPLFYLGSMGVVQRQAPMRLFHALGACKLHGEVCGASMSVLHAEGHPMGFDPEEIADSRFIVLWGVNMLSTCHHHWQFIKQARQRHGTRVVCIDPRRTRTAEQCDQHIAIRPGSDAILAAGLAHVMLAEGLADLDYARATAADFDALCEQVAAWTPERVAEACGIDARVVVGLARDPPYCAPGSHHSRPCAAKLSCVRFRRSPCSGAIGDTAVAVFSSSMRRPSMKALRPVATSHPVRSAASISPPWGRRSPTSTRPSRG